MTDGGCAASSRPLERDGDLIHAFAAGEAAQKVRDADFVDAFAERLRAGPRKRASWEKPISPHQHDQDFAVRAAALINGLAQSIRTGLTDSEGERPCPTIQSA